jgi:hypothetical protein
LKLENINKIEELIKRLRILEQYIDSQNNYDSKIYINGYSSHNSNKDFPIDIRFLLTDNNLRQEINNNVQNEINSIHEEILKLS